MKKFFEELSRRLREGGVESSNVEDRRLEIFLHGQPVLFVSPGNDVFLFPAGSNNPEASELYHRVAQTADEVYTYRPSILVTHVAISIIATVSMETIPWSSNSSKNTRATLVTVLTELSAQLLCVVTCALNLSRIALC